MYNINMSKKSLKEVFKEVMGGEIKLERYQKVGIILLLIAFAGFFGWVYEFIFYYFNGGMKEFYMQGGNYLPWINIYAIGAVLILVCCYKLRRWPWAVFLVSVVVTGLLELAAGWLIYTLFDGTRYWDYNTEILNFGNIGGFVCLRSVLVFGVSALFLMYVVLSFFVWLSIRMSKRAFLILAVTVFSVVMFDEVYNLLASKAFGWPSAMDFYRSMGLKYPT